MRKPVSADQARVEVCFRIGDNKYRVERIVKRTGTNEGRLYLNDNLLVGPKPSQVTERVEHELQVTYELFSRAVYSEQNQVDYFLKLNPADRKKKFDELLVKYETVRANANQVLNQFRKSQESDKHVLAQQTRDAKPWCEWLAFVSWNNSQASRIRNKKRRIKVQKYF